MRLRSLAAAAATAVTVLGSADIAAAAVDGPDVASYQHPGSAPIDWSRVKASGKDFAIIKATEGSTYTNPYFSGDWSASAAAGLVRGTYHYARPALPLSTAITQADHFAAAVGDLRHSGMLPPILDLEEDGGLSAGSLVSWTQAWLNEVQRKTGRVPMIYTYPYYWQHALANSSAFIHYPLWIADYNGGSAPRTPLVGGWPTWALWQYSATSSVSGISGGNVDMSVFNGDTSALSRFANGAAAGTQQITVPSAPTQVTASSGSSSAVVRWVPGNDGGSPVTSYDVLSSTGATTTVSGSSTSAAISGLDPSQSYTFRVRAVNAKGAGPWSDPSTPAGAPIPTTVHSWLTADSVNIYDTATMNATFSRTDTGAVLPGIPVTVYARKHGTSTWSTVATTTTDGTGTAHWSFPANYNTDVQMTYDAPAGWQSMATLVRTLAVHPTFALSLSRTAAGVGDVVTLTGHTTHRLEGFTVERQLYRGGAWQTVATQTVSPDATFTFPVTPTLRAIWPGRFPDTPGIRGTWPMRIRLESSTKYALTYSPTVSLTVN